MNDKSTVFSLADWGIIRVQGLDAKVFLQQQLSQDVLSLTATEARLAAYCSPKGRVLASFIIILEPTDETSGDVTDSFLLLCRSDIVASTIKRLSLFVLRSKLSIADASGEIGIFGLTNLAEAPLAWQHVGNAGVHAIGLPMVFGINRAMLLSPKNKPPLFEEIEKNLSYWHWLEVHSGIAHIYSETADLYVPQMLNYESLGAVDFKKGCYPGQEIVARSQFRGQIKRRLYIVHADAPLSPQASVFSSENNDEPVGGFVQSVHYDGQNAALAVLSTAAANDATSHPLRSAGHTLSLQPLPYVLRDDI